MTTGTNYIIIGLPGKLILSKGPSIYDVRKILGFFDPLPPLSAFGTDLQY